MPSDRVDGRSGVALSALAKLGTKLAIYESRNIGVEHSSFSIPLQKGERGSDSIFQQVII